MPIVAAIIGAAISIGGIVVSSVIGAGEAEEAKVEAGNIYNQRREDEERWRGEQNRLDKMRLGLQSKAQSLQETESRFARKERKEARDYSMRENQFQKQIGFLNANEGLKSNYLNFITRKAA